MKKLLFILISFLIITTVYGQDKTFKKVKETADAALSRSEFQDSLENRLAGADTTYTASEIDSMLNLISSDSDIQPLFFFNLGRGITIDTSLFNEIGSMIDPVFHRSGDTLVVTDITGGIKGKSGDTLQYQVMYSSKFGATDSTMVPIMEGSPMNLPVASNGIGNINENIIVNDTIPPDVWVWAQLVSVTDNDSITAFASIVSGYRIKGEFNDDPFATPLAVVQDTLGFFTTETGTGASLSSNSLRATKDTAQASGYIDTIYFLTSTSAGNDSLYLAIYDDNAGEPGNLLGSTGATEANLGILDWHSFPLQSQVNVVSGSIYWIAVLAKSTDPPIIYYLESSGVSRYRNYSSWEDGLPDPYGTGNTVSTSGYYMYGEIKN